MEQDNPPGQSSDLDSLPKVLEVIHSRLAQERRGILQEKGIEELEEKEGTKSILGALGLDDNREPGDTALPDNIIAMLEGVNKLREHLQKEGEPYKEDFEEGDPETGFKNSTLDNIGTIIDLTLQENYDRELFIEEDFVEEGATIYVTLNEPRPVMGYRRPHFRYGIEINYRDHAGLPPARYFSGGWSYEIKEDDLAIISDALARIEANKERWNISDDELEGL